MVSRLHLFIITALSLLLTSVILIMYTQQREDEFVEHQLAIQKAMVEGAARDIGRQLEEQIRHVRLFNDEYRQLISHLAYHPGDTATENIINTRLRQRFPNLESFSITTATGMPLLDDIETKVGDICKRDISSFSTEVRRLGQGNDAINTIFIHPQAEHYHYDVMASIKGGAPDRNVFFVSFKPQPIQEILKSHEIPGHKLMLTQLHDSSLIEISGAGTRDIMGRDGRLTTEELHSVKTYSEIQNTDWAMIDLKDPAYERAYISKLWKESGGIILIVSFTYLMTFFIFSSRIKYAEMRENRRKNNNFPWVKNKT